MTTEAQRATRSRERGSIAARIAAFWREIEPGISIHETFVERWDCQGEGAATCIAFEGFGLTLSMFVGRTPKREVRHG